MKIEYNYAVPEKWYEGLYKDRTDCCSAARPFSLLHKEKPEECWLLLHGYRGYPGELVRPAEDLFKAGFDVYVPRLPGHGTSGADFIRSHKKDWTGLPENAIGYLKTRYKKVNLLGHSMSSATVALLGAKDSSIGKLVYACPSFENTQMPLKTRLFLALYSPFKTRIKCPWHPAKESRLHYENAPCDNLYLGNEYWQFYFTRQLLEYYRLMKQGFRVLAKYPHEHLMIVPMKDRFISVPSVKLYEKTVKPEQQNVEYIEKGTHLIFYDRDASAEEQAVNAVMKFALEK